MKAATWNGSDADRRLPTGMSPVTLGACAAIALLMVFPAAAGALMAALALWGIVVALREGPLRPCEWAFARLALLLPAAVMLNMALTGWAMNLLDRPLHLAYSVLLMLLVARRGMSMRAFIVATMVAALASGLIAYHEAVIAGHERVFGLGGRWNAVPFGNFSLLMGSLSLAGALALQNGDGLDPRWLLAGLLAFASAGYASMMSGARGGWLALPVLLLIATHARRSIRPRLRVAMAAALLALAAVGFSFSDSVRARVDAAVANVSTFILDPSAPGAVENATGIRLAMWRWGIERFAEHPMTGIGHANFATYRAAAVERGEMPPHFNELSNLHNEIISSLAFGGLPSALALLAFWALAVAFFARRLRRSTDREVRYFATAGLLVVVGTALFSMTEGLLGTRSGTYGLTLLLALPAGALCHLAGGTDRRMPQ